MSDTPVSAARHGAPRGLVLGIGLVLALGGDRVTAQHTLSPSFLPANELLLQNYSADFPPLGPEYSSMRPAVLTDYLDRLLRETPAAPETFEMLVVMERPEQAADVLSRIIQTDPRQMSWAFELLWSRNVFSLLAGRTDPLPGLMAAARAQLSGLTSSEAARAERALIFLETRTRGAGPNPARSDALRDLITRYPGTDAALEAEVDLIISTTNDRAAWIEPLEEVARRHPGTTAAARALYERALQLSRNMSRPGVDPTEPFLEVLGIVRELESDQYPDSHWVRQAPWLAIELRPRDPQFGPGNAERLLAAYLEFVRAHFTLPELGQIAAGVGSVVTGQVFDLFDVLGEGVAGVERTLTELEAIDAPRARFLRGTFYMDRLRTEPAATRPATRQHALDTLSSLASTRSGLHARRALATLASLHYREGDFTAARAAFAAYLAAYPDTSWSWVAAIRLGQCHEHVGNLSQAIDAYRTAATQYASVRVAREQGHIHAGLASEAASRFYEALTDYESALQQWGDLRRTSRMESGDRRDLPDGLTPREMQGLALQERVVQLRRSLASPDGPSLERVRWLLTTGEHTGALAAAEAFLGTYPTSNLAPEAQRLILRARLEIAIALAGPANASGDEDAALDTLAAFQMEPWTEVVGVARIVRAALLARRGSRAEADSEMTMALRAWQQEQLTSGDTDLPADVVRDVADIRRRIFEGEDGAAPWRAPFEWRRGNGPPFLVVNPHITVQLGDAVPTRAMIYPTSAADSVLFMASEPMAMLVDAINALVERDSGDRPRRIPRDLATFLTAHLPTELGMVGGVTSFASIPNVQSVTFTDEARTRATVVIRTFSSGGELLMRKEEGTWRVAGVGLTYVN